MLYGYDSVFDVLYSLKPHAADPALAQPPVRPVREVRIHLAARVGPRAAQLARELHEMAADVVRQLRLLRKPEAAHVAFVFA